MYYTILSEENADVITDAVRHSNDFEQSLGPFLDHIEGLAEIVVEHLSYGGLQPQVATAWGFDAAKGSDKLLPLQTAFDAEGRTVNYPGPVFQILEH